MPLYDFRCECGHIFEAFAGIEERTCTCPVCGSVSRRVVSIGASAYRHDAPWIESVLAVVDKESRLPHTRAFIETPTRESYRMWMAENNIRPMDDGEHRHRQRPNEEAFVRQMAEKIVKHKRKRETIELRDR